MRKVIFIFLVSLILGGSSSIAQQSFKVDIVGKGKPVLLFPGFGCTGQVWEETVKVLSSTHKCYTFTFAGFGGVKPVDTLWFETIKGDVEKYIKGNGLQESILIGHSLGGTLSLWLASDHPRWFEGIILVDALPASAALMIPNYKGELISYDNPQSKSMLNMSEEEFRKMNVQSAKFMCNNKEKQALIAEMMNQSDRKTYVYGYIDMMNLDLRQRIAGIKKPVTILAATNPNIEMVRKTYGEQYSKLPSVEIRYAEKSAHFVMYDQPEWFSKQILELVK